MYQNPNQSRRIAEAFAEAQRRQELLREGDREQAARDAIKPPAPVLTRAQSVIRQVPLQRPLSLARMARLTRSPREF